MSTPRVSGPATRSRSRLVPAAERSPSAPTVGAPPGYAAPSVEELTAPTLRRSTRLAPGMAPIAPNLGPRPRSRAQVPPATPMVGGRASTAASLPRGGASRASSRGAGVLPSLTAALRSVRAGAEAAGAGAAPSERLGAASSAAGAGAAASAAGAAGAPPAPSPPASPSASSTTSSQPLFRPDSALPSGHLDLLDDLTKQIDEAYDAYYSPSETLPSSRLTASLHWIVNTMRQDDPAVRKYYVKFMTFLNVFARTTSRASPPRFRPHTEPVVNDMDYIDDLTTRMEDACAAYRSNSQALPSQGLVHEIRNVASTMDTHDAMSRMYYRDFMKFLDFFERAFRPSRPTHTTTSSATSTDRLPSSETTVLPPSGSSTVPDCGPQVPLLLASPSAADATAAPAPAADATVLKPASCDSMAVAAAAPVADVTLCDADAPTGFSTTSLLQSSPAADLIALIVEDAPCNLFNFDFHPVRTVIYDVRPADPAPRCTVSATSLMDFNGSRPPGPCTGVAALPVGGPTPASLAALMHGGPGPPDKTLLLQPQLSRLTAVTSWTTRTCLLTRLLTQMRPQLCCPAAC